MDTPVYIAECGHIFAAVQFPHSAYPVLAIHQIIVAIPVTDHQRIQQTGVPLPHQPRNYKSLTGR